jgi:6-phospho-beta-glucosidase
MREISIAVIGAGSTYTPELMQGFIERKDVLCVKRFMFCDTDKERLETLAAFAERMLKKAGISSKVERFSDMRKAIAGADYVLAQVRVGKMPARIIDESIPLKFGMLGQETTGIGGMVNGLRTVPVILELAKAMEELVPDAWLINFSNPSGMVAEAVLNNSSIKMAGLCNAPFKMVREAKALLGACDGFDYDFMGLNHLCWLTGVYVNGTEMLSKLLSMPLEESGLANIPDMEYSPAQLRAMGGFPSGYLNYYYHRGEMTKKCLEAEKTRGEICLDIERELLEMYRDKNVCDKPALLEKRGGAYYSEAAVSLLESLENDRNDVHVVNVKNCGTASFLPPDAVVETRCTVGRAGICPLPPRKQSSVHIQGMMQAVKAYERLAVKAAIEGDFEAALAALMTHPLTCDLECAEPALIEMLDANKKYLPRFAGYFDKEGVVD